MLNHEHVQTSADPSEQVRTWLTIEEAHLLCLEQELNRTRKTIRRWCRKGSVESHKQDTPNGSDSWVIDKQSLQVKIKQELDYIAQQKQQVARSGANHEGNKNDERTCSDMSEHVQTSTDKFEHVRTGVNMSEQGDTNVPQEQFEELNAKIRSLKMDRAVRDQQIIWLSKQNEEGQTNLLAQSRYIGHLETKVMQLGGEADKSFLEAPQSVSEVVEPEVVHPNQNNLGV